MVIRFWTMSTGRTIMKMSTTTIERVSIITCGHLRTWSMHIITSLQTIIIKPIWTTLVTGWHDQCITSIKAGWDVDLVNLLVGLGRQMDFDDHTRWLVAFIIFIVLPSSGFFNKQDIILVGVTWHMAAPRQHYDVHNIGSLFWPPHNVSDNCLCWDDWLALTWDGKRRVPMAMAHHTETLMNRNLQETHIIGCRNVKLAISGHLQKCKEVELYKDFEKQNVYAVKWTKYLLSRGPLRKREG